MERLRRRDRALDRVYRMLVSLDAAARRPPRPQASPRLRVLAVASRHGRPSPR